MPTYLQMPDVNVSKPNGKHTEYAKVYRTLGPSELLRVKAFYKAALSEGEYSYDQNFVASQVQTSGVAGIKHKECWLVDLCVHFSVELAARAKTFGIDIYFVCDRKKLEDYLSSTSGIDY